MSLINSQPQVPPKLTFGCPLGAQRSLTQKHKLQLLHISLPSFTVLSWNKPQGQSWKKKKLPGQETTLETDWPIRDFVVEFSHQLSLSSHDPCERTFLSVSLCAREVGGHPSGPRALRLLQDRHHQVVSVRDLRQRKGQCLQLPVATNSSLNPCPVFLLIIFCLL